MERNEAGSERWNTSTPQLVQISFPSTISAVELLSGAIGASRKLPLHFRHANRSTNLRYTIQISLWGNAST